MAATMRLPKTPTKAPTSKPSDEPPPVRSAASNSSRTSVRRSNSLSLIGTSSSAILAIASRTKGSTNGVAKPAATPRRNVRIICASPIVLTDRVMDGHQLGAVRKRGFDLDVMDHLGDARHALVRRDHMRPGLHQVGHRPTVACAFDHEIGDQRDGLGVVQFHPPE